jgi:hypothetical protein
MPSPEPKPLRDFYEKGKVLLEEARTCPDPDMKEQLYKAADRYFKADIDLTMAKETGNNKIGDIMAAEAQPNKSPVEKDSPSLFYSFLEQALTLGARGIRQSALPTFIGYLVYVALAALLTTGIWLNRPQVTAATIVLLMIVGLLAILLLFEVPKKIRPVVAEIILILVVVCFLGVSAYAVFRLLAPPSTPAETGVKGGTTGQSTSSTLAIGGTVIDFESNDGISQAEVATVGGADRTVTDDRGNFYLPLNHQTTASNQIQLSVLLRVVAKGHRSLTWKAVAPVNDLVLPLKSTSGLVSTRGKPDIPLTRIIDPEVAADKDAAYKSLFQQAQGDELALSRLGEKAFAALDYGWAVKFLSQGKQVAASKVWERDYPLLAAATELSTHDDSQFRAILQEMLAEMRLNHSYLHHSTTIGFVLDNLSYVRQYLKPASQRYLDETIIPAAIDIKKNLVE